MLETKHPTARHLERVTSRLVTVHPSVADKVPGGCPYVSEIEMSIMSYLKYFSRVHGKGSYRINSKT